MLGDAIIGGAIAEPEALKKASLVVVTTNGHIKRIPIDEFPVQGRGGQGVQLWKVNKATGLVSGAALVNATVSDVDIYSLRGKRCASR